MVYLHLFFNVIITVFFIGIIILMHEMGHYLAAKLTGVRVERFAFGLPLCGPVIFRKKIFETEFIFHLLFFFGGYIAYPESNPRCELPMDSPKRFLNKTPLQKSFITLAGILMNIIISFILILIIGIIWKFIPVNDYNVQIASLKDNAAESILNSGIKKDDIIYTVNNKKLNNKISLQEYLRVYQPQIKKQRNYTNDLLNKNNDNLLIYFPDLYLNKTAVINVIRDNKKLSVNNITPNNDGSLGLNLKISENYAKVTSFTSLIKNSFKCIYNQLYILFYYLKELITGNINITDIRGLFSIIKISAELGTYDGFFRILWMMSFLSLNMALINILPIPVLDGGKFLIILSGNLFRHPVKRKTMEKIMRITFKSFNIIILLIILNDLISIIKGIV